MATSSVLNEALESLERMQSFDPKSLSRRDDLGTQLNFDDAILPATRLVDLYKRLAPSVLQDFPDAQLAQIKTIANADYSRFKGVLDFSAEQGNPTAERNNLINQIRGSYDNSFNQLWQFIAYGVSKTVDSQRLETESRAVLQSVQDEAAKLTKALEADKEKSEAILADVRKTAAEQGISQQATYFRSEADEHEVQAGLWKASTQKWAAGTIGFALLALFIHKLPLLEPADNYQAAQLIASKVLIFAVLAYMLGLSGRIYLAHKHNSIVNRHRQNALLTYKSISDAAKAPERQDVILSYAASCIFAPQETGYNKHGVGGNDASAVTKSVIELLPKPHTS